MKKLISIAIIGLAAVGAFAAMDTAQTYHDELLPAQSTTLIQTNTVILAPAKAAGGETVTSGAAVDVSGFPGTVLLTVAMGTGIDSTYTGTVTTILFGDTGPATTTTVTQTGTTAGKVVSIEKNLDTLQGTNAYLYATSSFVVVCGGGATTQAVASVIITRGAARAATQTITGSAVDTINYKGYGTIVVDVGTPLNGSTAYTNVVTVQYGTTSTGAWTTVSAVTNTAADVDEIPYEFGKGGRYIRAVVTTANDAGPVSATINAFK